MSDRSQRPGCFLTAALPVGLFAAWLVMLAT